MRWRDFWALSWRLGSFFLAKRLKLPVVLIVTNLASAFYGGGALAPRERQNLSYIEAFLECS
jgi:hypothetical protein